MVKVSERGMRTGQNKRTQHVEDEDGKEKQRINKHLEQEIRQ